MILLLVDTDFTVTVPVRGANLGSRSTRLWWMALAFRLILPIVVLPTLTSSNFAAVQGLSPRLSTAG
jgi:hypothetical protein